MGGARILDDEQLETMSEMREVGLTYTQIARHFAARGTLISPATIRWQCLRLGVEAPVALRRPMGGDCPGAGRSFTPEEDSQLLELEANGTTKAAIARALGRRTNSVNARLYTLARMQARSEELAA